MTRCLSILLLLTALAVRAGEPPAGYLMGYCTASPKGTGNSPTLHLATSEDGLDWMPLNQNAPVLAARLGQKSLSDPHFLRKLDGGFLVLAGNGAGESAVATPDILVWDTADFVTFNNERLVKLHDTPMHTRAPEAIFDPARNQYAIIWSGDSDRYRTYVNYTKDFMTVSPREVYFDSGRDATVCRGPDPTGYFLYFRDTASNRLCGARSSTLAAGSFDGKIYTKPIGTNITGAPLLVKAPHESRWFLYGDSNSAGNDKFHAWQSADITTDDWREINRRDYNPPLNFKQATVIPLTRAELDRLIARWGRPKWSRLKSYNLPDWLVRHENLQAKISCYPFDPSEDSQWILVPGLADPKGVSFESANFPDHYLRTVAEHVVLSKNDGSPAFKTKATFLKVPGLADGSWSSFQSFSSPDLYLRHANYFLRLEPVASPADQEDATFRIVY